MAMTGSAPMSPEMKAFVESVLDMHLVDGYGSTEAGVVFVDGADPASAGDRLQAGRRPRSRLLRHRPATSPGRAARQDRHHVPRLLQAARGHRGRVRRRTATTAPATSSPRPARTTWSTSIAATTCSSCRRVSSSPSPSWRPCSATARWSGRSTSTATAPALSAGGRRADREALSRVRNVKPLIGESLQNVARPAGLQSYEMPRDFIVETTPFTLENGLLTGIRKLAWPKLKAALRRPPGAALRRTGRRAGRRAARTARTRRRRAGARDRQPRGGCAARRGAVRSARRTHTSPIWAETRCPR